MSNFKRLVFVFCSAFSLYSFGNSDLSKKFPWLSNPAPNPFFDPGSLEEVPEVDLYVSTLLQGYTEAAYRYINTTSRKSFLVEEGDKKIRIFPVIRTENMSEELREGMDHYSKELGLSFEELHTLYVRYYHQMYAFYQHDVFREIELVQTHHKEECGEIWRGVDDCQYYRGPIFVDDGFVSTSEDQSVAEGHADAGGCLIKYLRGGAGINVTRFSASKWEREWLLVPHQAYEVVEEIEASTKNALPIVVVKSLGPVSQLDKSNATHARAIEYWNNLNLERKTAVGDELESLIQENKNIINDADGLKTKMPDVLITE